MAPPKNKDAQDGAAKKPPRRRRMVEKDTEEYKVKRERNNVSVKKSRNKAREKAKLTIDKVSRLRMENEQLEEQVKILSKELGVLKDLFKMAHPPNGGQCAVNGAEAGIQTEVIPVVPEMEEVAEHEGTEQADETKDGIEVNREALMKDHEYSAVNKL